MRGNAECIWPLAMTLGEGPAWDARSRCLWFVDIKQGMLHRYDPHRDDRTSFDIGGSPGFVLPALPDGLVIGNGGTLLHRLEGQTHVLARLSIDANSRCNDATVDPSGRVWFGTMDDRALGSSGRVHVYDQGEVTIAGGASIVPNGPAITADGRWLYHVDSLDRTIWRFDIAGRKRLEDGAPVIRIVEDDGVPDGVILDAEDHLWVGMWGGWCARRYAPDGRLVDEVEFPCANVTKIALGGPDMRTAFATTARFGESAEALAEQPLAGGLFQFRVDVPGRSLPLARTR